MNSVTEQTLRDYGWDKVHADGHDCSTLYRLEYYNQYWFVRFDAGRVMFSVEGRVLVHHVESVGRFRKLLTALGLPTPNPGA